MKVLRALSDRRNRVAVIVSVIAVLSVSCFWTALALAASTRITAVTGEDSLVEHTVVLMNFQWWLIGGLFTVAAGALVFIYMSGQKSTRGQFKALFDKLDRMNDQLDERITHTQHSEIDHSVLCAICRRGGKH